MVSLLGGDEKYTKLYDIPEEGSKKPEEYKRLKRLRREIDIISRISYTSDEESTLTSDEIKLIDRWVVNLNDMDLLQRINIQLLDFYMTADDIPVVSFGLNEHWIVFTCGNYPFTYPSVYKVVGSRKMVEIKEWVDKNIDDEDAKLNFMVKLNAESGPNPAITVSHILRHIILLAPLLIPEAADEPTKPMGPALSLLCKLRF